MSVWYAEAMKIAQQPTAGYIGAMLWAFSIQYYIVQIVVAADWPPHNAFSLTTNTISDLANTVCGPYGNRLVCSPLHSYMNASFIVLGVTMIIGAYLLQKALQAGRWAAVGFGCMATAGVGTILVGLFPENSVSFFHILGAGLTFTLGNIAMILIGLSLKQLRRALRGYTVASGVIGLIGTVLFVTHVYLGIGGGTIERLAAYPQSIWMIIFGIAAIRVFVFRSVPVPRV